MRRFQQLASAGLLAAGAVVLALFIAAAMPKPPAPPDSPLGFMVIDIADEQAAASYHVEEMGVYVLAVDEGSHASRVGIQTGDRLLRVNGTAIAHSTELFAMQESFEPMQSIQMEFLRSNDPFAATLIWNETNEQEEEELRI